jgi:hypothetical protein
LYLLVNNNEESPSQKPYVFCIFDIPTTNNQTLKKPFRTLPIAVLFLISIYPAANAVNLISPPDSSHKPDKEWHPDIQIALNAGLSLPLGVYGSNNYVLTEQKTSADKICGFASPSFTANALFSVALGKGWKLTCMGDYIHNGFNATGFLNENADLLGEYYSPTATGTYSFDNYAFFGGFTKCIFNSSKVYIDLRVMVGGFYLNIPSVQGTGYELPDKAGGIINISLPGVQEKDMALDGGFTIGYKILPFMSAIFNTDYMFGGGGISYNSASFTKGNLDTIDPDIAMFNFNVGIQLEWQ